MKNNKNETEQERVGLSHNCFNNDCYFCCLKNCECDCYRKKEVKQ